MELLAELELPVVAATGPRAARLGAAHHRLSVCGVS